MSQRLWLLVDWLDINELFPSFGIVNIDRFAYRGNEICSGKEVMIRIKQNEPRPAKIVRVAGNKYNVMDHKLFLEVKEQRINYTVEKFRQRIDEILTAQKRSNQPGQGCPVHKPVPTILARTDDEDSSDQEVGGAVSSSTSKRSRSAHASQSKHKQVDSTRGVTQSCSPALNQRRPSMISSTPLPDSRSQKRPVKITFDQGTQTDACVANKPSLKEIEDMEAEVLRLYKRYQCILLNHANASESDDEVENEEIEEIDISSTADDTMNSTSSSVRCIEENIVDVNFMQRNSASPKQMRSTSTVPIEEPEIGNAENQPCSSNDTQVRRMSAQTTDSLDLVPIGDGHAMIPARVLNEIDFRSYTTATRQLLQATFSRHVLATHSLTGKQSPAHANKPPKKVLDPKLVNDIVKTVVNRCGVSTSLARNCITVKCTDEAKLYRNRQMNRETRQRKHHQSDENMQSSHTSSDEFH